VTDDPTSTPTVILPFEGAAGVPFGATRASVRGRLGTPAYSTRSSQWEDHLTDWYVEAGLVFGYGDDGTVDQIQLISPSDPEVGGVALFDGSSRSVHAAIVGLGLEVRSALGLWEVPAWGVSLFVQGDALGDRPFDAVTAFAHGPAPEPEFLGTPAAEPVSATEVDADGFGPVRLGMAREQIRALLGEGMTAAIPGRDQVDFHFGAKAAVTYDRDDTARRICVMTPGATAAGTQVGVGQEYGHCVTALREAGIGFAEHEAEIQLTDSGIRLQTARTGDPALPVVALVVERASKQ
jgi:hypothetical protein